MMTAQSDDPSDLDPNDDAPEDPTPVGVPAIVAESGNEPDPFQDFEDDSDEVTHIDDRNLIAEQPTHILEDAPEPPFLKVEAGSDIGRQFVLNPGETHLGRSIDNDIILTDVAVSRRHLTVTFDGKGFYVRDLGSGNGTLVNASPVRDGAIFPGDRIQIGETVLRLNVPVASEPSATGTAADVSIPTPVLTDQGLQTAPGRKRTEAFPSTDSTAPGSASPTVSVPLTPPQEGTPPRTGLFAAMLIGGLAIAALAAFGVAMAIRGSSDGPNEDSMASEALEKGIASYQARHWDEARRSFRQVLESAPKDSRALRYVGKVDEAQKHERVVQGAKVALAKGRTEEALKLLLTVPPTSLLAKDADALVAQAQNKRIEALVAAARTANAKGSQMEARLRLAEARAIRSNDARVVALEKELDSVSLQARRERERDLKSTANREKAADPASKRPTTETRVREHALATKTTSTRRSEAQDRAAVLSAYKKGDFSAAAQVARRLADAASDREHREFVQLAERIERFSQVYSKISRAADKGSLVPELQNAIAIDEQVSGGHYSRSLRASLASAYGSLAQTASNRGDLPSACRNVRNALGIDSRLASAQRLEVQCERHAGELVSQASGLETSNPARAKSLYRDVLNLVPRTSAHYQTAYRRLNFLSRPDLSDEDE